jgi:transcriptional regulator with XRE-family HTH domain
MASLGQQLVALREAKGWSRNRLHQKSGVAFSYLTAIEKDEWLPGKDNLKRIVKALGPEAGSLLEERERLEYERLGLDPDTSLALREISDDLTDRDRDELLAVQHRIRQRQQHRK